MAELMLSQGSLREIAEQTGGIASVNTNSLTNTFNQIVQANSRYYVLGYYPPEHSRNGRFHKIEVKTKRPGLRVAARKGYGSPRGRTAEERKRDEAARRAREAKRPNADKTSTELREIITSPDAERAQRHRARRAVQEHAEEASIALARDRRRSPAILCARREGMAANKIELSFYASASTARRWRAPAPSSISAAPRSVSASSRSACADPPSAFRRRYHLRIRRAR